MRYADKVNVCVDLLDPDEETFKRAMSFINEGEMIRCLIDHNGKQKEKACVYGFAPRDEPQGMHDAWLAWLKCKELTLKNS